MNLASLSSASLRNALSLVEKREKLLGEIEAIEGEITKTLGDGYFPWNVPSDKSSATPKAKTTRKGKSSGLKEKIVAELQAAGKAGVSVKDLADKLGVKAQNINVWFYTTGKKVGAKRIGRGVFAI